MGKLRNLGFRLGQSHGLLTAQKSHSEAQLQRDVYFLGSAAFELSRERRQIIRWAGYEMPLFKVSRGQAVDLVGYDSDFNVYLVELKTGKSSEKISEVIQQINEYADIFEKIICSVEAEFNAAFFCDVKFAKIRKVILAPSPFFDQGVPKDGDVAFASFARLGSKDQGKLLRRQSPIRLSLLNRKRVLKLWEIE